MNASKQSATFSQLEGILRKVAAQCPSKEREAVLSDIYFMPVPAEGTLTVTDDEGNRLYEGVVEAWRQLDPARFYAVVQSQLQEAIARQRSLVEGIHFLRPFSLVLVDADHETIAELYLVDDDTLLLSENLMEGLEEDLDAFLKQLMEA